MMQRGYEAVMINSRRSPWSSEKTPKKCLGVVLAVVDVTAQPERRKEKHRAEQVVDGSVLPWKFGGLLPLLGFLGFRDEIPVSCVNADMSRCHCQKGAYIASACQCVLSEVVHMSLSNSSSSASLRKVRDRDELVLARTKPPSKDKRSVLTTMRRHVMLK
ncbi:hypothetical protein J3A83DRAFT_4285464 [Scleroderma citrinum]